MKIYHAINAVQTAMAKEGIAKASVNQSQGYAFRSIDAVYAALSPHLAANKLCVLPRVVSRDVTERTNKNGTAIFYTTLTVEFDFVAVEDGSKHTVVTVGEAMDSGDKSSNKAMSAAYKYACFLTFCIPTEGDNDADATTHSDVVHRAPPPPALASNQQKAELAAALASPETGAKLETFLSSKGITLDNITAKQADAILEKLKK